MATTQKLFKISSSNSQHFLVSWRQQNCEISSARGTGFKVGVFRISPIVHIQLLFRNLMSNLVLRFFLRSVYPRVVHEFFETITILSKGLIIIKNNLHSHHIWDLWLNYPTVAFNGYDPVAF